jgi:hypothetical protein
VLQILFQIDPIGVQGQDNTEKFVPEATSILPRLREARFAEDVETIVHQELRGWYGRRRLAYEDPLLLTRVTLAICSAWNRFLDSSAS